MAEGFITRKGGGVNVNDATATENDVLQGETFYSGDKDIKTGNIPSKGAETFTPSTSNQTISSGQYLTGTQTILGDSDLVPSNIVDGVSIFGVTGTFVGGDSYLSFDGVDDYVDLTSLGFNINNVSSGSVEMDIALYAQNEVNPYILAARDGSSNSRFFIRVTDQDVINYRVGGTSSNSNYTVTYGEQFNLRLEWSSGQYSVYINNQLDVGPLNYSGSGTAGSYDYALGSSQAGTSGYTHMDLFYIKQINNGNTFYEYDISEGLGTTLNDLSGNNNDGTIYGATWEQ